MARSRAYFRRERGGYTLIEVLVVMGIIVLAIALAIPAIRSLTGSKSQQGAQNTIAAYLARARTDAVGLQQITGVLFYIDTATDRVNLREVTATGAETGDVPGVLYLALAPDRDPLVLPPGIRMRTYKDSPPSPPPGAAFVYKDPFPNARYLGFDDNSTTGYNVSPPKWDKGLPGGVILFDGGGRTVTREYGFRFSSAGFVAPLQSLFAATPAANASNWPVLTGGTVPYLRSQIAFALFDRETFLNAGFTDQNVSAKDVAANTWIDTNTALILVNRYNGTLTRAE